MLSQKLFPECLGTQTRLPIKPPFHLRPHPPKRIFMRAPSPLASRLQRTGCPAIYFDPVLWSTPAFAALRPILPLFSYSFISLLCCCGTDHARCRSLRDLHRAIPNSQWGIITVADQEL